MCRLRLLVALLMGCAGCAGGSADDATAAQDLVGGTHDTRWVASGYLTAGASLDTLDRAHAACGATLVAPNVVVTAAHCVLRAPDATWAFGTGDLGSNAPLVRVIERRVHPEFHARPEGLIDIPRALRKNDLAYLVLEHPVSGVAPAELPDAAPADGCNAQAIGYHAERPGSPSERVTAPACVEFKVQLGDDPIFEVHPAGFSGLCAGDGDEGGAVVLRDASRQVLVGVYAGSVTAGITDCRRGFQFLDGYESAFGYRAFFEEGIARGNDLLR
jgi:Trypsin